MRNCEKNLLRLIRARCLKLGKFTLASGMESDYYIDLKTIMVSGRGVALIGKVLYKHTRDLPVDSFGGMGVGAIPLTAATVIRYHRRGKCREGFWVRPEVKDHGTGRTVEGFLADKDHVIILEDVATTGASIMRVVDAIRERGVTVKRIVALVDREQGAKELFEKDGLDFRPVFTIGQILKKK